MTCKQFVKAIAILLFLAGIVASQVFFDKAKGKAAYFEPKVLQSDVVRVIDLGLHNAAADLAWLAAIQYVGGGQTKTYEKLLPYLTLSSDLDPKFSYPYAFGALMLPGFGQTDEAIDYAEKGTKEAIPDWQIPYYLAFTYHLEKQDYENSAKYFDLAAKTPGAPDNIQRIAANYGSSTDRRQQTKQIWIGIMEASDDEIAIERASSYVMHYEILDLLERAANDYKNRFNEYPKDISNLLTANILLAIPPDPFGFEYTIDENGRARIKN